MRFDGKFRSLSRMALLFGGIALIVGGVMEAGRVPLAYLRVAVATQSAASKQLVKIQVHSPPPAQVVSYSVHALYPRAALPGKQPPTGAFVGHLKIPSLGIDAPVTQGTSLSILAESAGHLESSVLPGEVGTSILAAHDVTYFHRIDLLTSGDILTVQTSQGVFEYKVVRHQVIQVGTDVPNTPYPSLVLETCYPLNALQLVNRRYVVSAVLVSSRLPTPSPATNK